MTRLLLFLLIIILLYLLFRAIFRSLMIPKDKEKSRSPEELVQDPYCLTYIPKSMAVKKRMNGYLLYFCCDQCMKHYLKREIKKDKK